MAGGALRKEVRAMALLTKKITAATLPEVVVASVVWLLFFLLTLGVLVYVGTSRTDNSDLLAAEMELRACRTEANRMAANETVTRSYEWGKIEIRKEQYAEGVVRIWLKATVERGGKEIRYTCLAQEKQ